MNPHPTIEAECPRCKRRQPVYEGSVPVCKHCESPMIAVYKSGHEPNPS